MKFTSKLLSPLLILFLLNCSSGKQKLLQLRGEVIGTDSKSIMLIKPNQDPRFDSIIEIPVVDGKFYYEAKLEYPEAVNLAFAESVKNGAYRPMPLFLENESIELTIYGEQEFDKNSVQGGNLNAKYNEFNKSLENKFNNKLKPLQDSMLRLSKNDAYHSDKARVLYAELRESKNQDENIIIYKKLEKLRESGQYLSPKAKEIEGKLSLIYDGQNAFKHEYMSTHNSLISYYLLLNDLQSYSRYKDYYNKETITVDLAKETYNALKETNPDHPYNKLAGNLIDAIENIQVGKPFTDFSAPDLNGSEFKLSNQIKGKVALLDLWATWCGPCIAKSRTMVPVYNEYKDKGFTIIGVAGEFKGTDRLTRFLEKEKWEWLNLVELDRQNNLWQKYGVDGGGGGIFLIDENGIILAKDPTADEVRIELESRLNKNI
ncbi:TlpA disulfide reductase family protein [Aestuariibaculum sp. YM273]|uniref:TlpA disulfide reductase family protein n=1 Tax=Aestuariibaculum sp. YM273 TaxID=3070659 RepID=UPI0027DD21DF|nr:TlpA disulfide reductase family protein [Aestuariibaculum sp. YM273]WMI66765.1 TlpA disulfide reductase family protein [Aestuariibaculum sp. YM273]